MSCRLVLELRSRQSLQLHLSLLHLLFLIPHLIHPNFLSGLERYLQFMTFLDSFRLLILQLLRRHHRASRQQSSSLQLYLDSLLRFHLNSRGDQQPATIHLQLLRLLQEHPAY